MNRWNCSPGGAKKLSGRLILQSIILAVTVFSGPPSFAQEPFDHFSTSFPLDGAHLNVTCEACHSGA